MWNLGKGCGHTRISSMKQYINNFLSNVSGKQKIGWDFPINRLLIIMATFGL
jgi:hypothetical protein